MENENFEAIQKSKIRYSQSTLSRYFNDELTPVEAWTNRSPYTIPVEVMQMHMDNADSEYISLDNRRLYSVRQYSSHDTINCFVHNPDSAVTDAMVDHGIDILKLIWQDGEIIHRLLLRTTTIQGVFIIRCAGQNSVFSLDGRHTDPVVLSGRERIDGQIKLSPYDKPRFFIQCTENITDSLEAAEIVYMQRAHNVNLFHPRTDLKRLIIDTNIFELELYERGTNIQLIARGEKNEDDWDDLNAAVFNAENEIYNLYDEDFVRSH